MKILRVVGAFLWPVAFLYGALTRLRAESYRRGWLRPCRLKGVVISVGNLTVGGTGKTPMVLWLAERLLAKGERIAILTRGYRGSGGSSDEVELLRARLGDRVPVGVGKNRHEQGMRLEAQGYDCFLLDDGFQHLQLARDMDIVLLDASRPLESPGNSALLPAGRLREPLSALRRADIVVMTRSSLETSVAARDSRTFSVFHANTRLLGFRILGGGADLHGVDELGIGTFFAFCGVGNPEAFFSDLMRWHVNVAGKMAFRDHHRYSPADVCRLEAAAVKAGATALVTTEKDACNLCRLQFASLPVYVAAVEMEPNSEAEFLAAIERKIAAHRGGAA
jgi:tetraacyldisaccharide 4'-kinase